MEEKICICAVCQTDDSIWCVDAIIGGLYRLDKYNRNIKCVISPMQMFEEGYFPVRKLIYWNGKIFILPTTFAKKWIVYNIDAEKMEYIHPVPFHIISEETVVIGNRAFCIPFFSDEPVLVLNLKTMQCDKKLNICGNGGISGDIFEIWNAKLVKNKAYFLLRNSSLICIINTIEEKIIILEMPEEIVCADFCGNNGWALSITGKILYKVDEKGICLEKIKMETEQKIVRLVATYRYIFLLPQEGSTICVYDQCSHKFKFINSGVKEIEHLLPETLYFSSYWDYIIEGDKIHFMPCRYPYLIVDLVTLKYKQGDFSYSYSFLKYDYWKYYYWIQKLRKRIFIEETKENLTGLLNMITHSEVEELETTPQNLQIWECIKKEGLQWSRYL